MNEQENIGKQKIGKSWLLLAVIFGLVGLLSLFTTQILDMAIPCHVTQGYCHPLIGSYIDFFKEFLQVGPLGLLIIFILSFGSWFLVGLIPSFLLRSFVARHKGVFIFIILVLAALIPVGIYSLNVAAKSYAERQLNQEGTVKLYADGSKFIYKNGTWQPY